MAHTTSFLSGLLASFGLPFGKAEKEVSHASRRETPQRRKVTQAELEDLFEIESDGVFIKEDALRDSERLERDTLTMIRGALYQTD